MASQRVQGHLTIFITNIFFAINIPISKFLLPEHITPEGLTMIRMLSGTSLFWIASLVLPKESVPIKDIALFFVCGMCGIALNQGSFIMGLSKTSPIDASVIITATPIIVMVLAALILKEPITKMKAGGVFIGIVGAITIILASNSLDSAEQSSSFIGNSFVLFSSFIYSFYLVIAKPLVQKYSAVTMMKWMFLFSLILLLPFNYKSVLYAPIFCRETIIYDESMALFYVMIFGTFIPYLLIPMALKRIRPTTVSIYNYIQPIIASFIAIAVGQDRFTLLKLFAAILVFLGVYLVTQSKSRADMESKSKA